MLFVSRIDSGRSLTPSALALLECYDWPGNVRELANVIERSIALCDSTVLDERDIKIDRLFEDSDPGALSPSEGRRDSFDANEFCERAAIAAVTLKELERNYIEEVLRLTAGNKTAAARILGLNRTTLYRRKP
jgi:DNA-binding NtrC family response regulator